MFSRNVNRLGIQQDAVLICLFFSTIALCGGVGYAEYRYQNAEYILTGNIRLLYKFTGDIKEPFATVTNICQLTTAFTITLFTYFHGKPLHHGIYMSMTLVTILAALSWAYHSTGSVPYTWQHHGDRYGMFATFTWMTAFNCITMFNTFFPVQTSLLKKLLGVITLIGGQIAMVVIIIDEWEYNSGEILLKLGFTAFTPTFLISWRQTYHAFDRYKFLKSFIYAAYTTMTPVLVFGLAYLYQTHGESIRRCNGCVRNNPDYYARNIEIISRYDMFHGVWHYLSGICIALLVCLQADQVQGKVLLMRCTKTRILPHITLWITMCVYLALYYKVETAQQLRLAILIMSPITILLLSVQLYFRSKQVLVDTAIIIAPYIPNKDDTESGISTPETHETPEHISDSIEISVM